MHQCRRRPRAAADLPAPHRVGRDSSARSVSSAAPRAPFPDMRKFLITIRPAIGLASASIRAARAVA